jgi:GNAT superfamily N-acetyltransferase
MNWHRNNYSIDTEKSKLDLCFIHNYLSNHSYWAQDRTSDVVEKSIEHSLCFGVYDRDQQVGFARVVTDTVTFAWLCDVFIENSYQTHGLGKWLLECIIAHPQMQTQKNIILATRDAHDYYRRYGGFEALARPRKWMHRSGEIADGK